MTREVEREVSVQAPPHPPWTTMTVTNPAVRTLLEVASRADDGEVWLHAAARGAEERRNHEDILRALRGSDAARLARAMRADALRRPSRAGRRAA